MVVYLIGKKSRQRKEKRPPLRVVFKH